jgi:hypothetical protein
MGKDEKVVTPLFFLDSPDNINHFMTYCGKVNLALKMNSKTTPQYAQEYFLYYSIWQIRD